MKKCELCQSPAKMYCESDQASLCWDCDTKVHGANFLVAKHIRTLLCHICQSVTRWNGSGPKLGPTVSACNVCVVDSSGFREEGNNGETQNDEENDCEEEDDDDDEDGDDSSDDDEENQVVPRSSTTTPPISSSSTSDQEFPSKFCNGEEGISVKRMFETTKFHSENHRGYSSAQQSKNSYLCNEIIRYMRTENPSGY